MHGLSNYIHATEEEIQKAYELWFAYLQENPDEQPSLAEFADSKIFAEQAQQGLFRFLDLARIELRKSSSSE